MEKPTITYDRSGPSGNIYAILGAVSQTLRKQRRYTDFNTLRDRVFEAKKLRGSPADHRRDGQPRRNPKLNNSQTAAETLSFFYFKGGVLWLRL